ncbi:hypothetical protein Plhal304r1_c017g0062251 [Plasmopara halstedii]
MNIFIGLRTSHKRLDRLSLLAASQTRDKDALTEGVEKDAVARFLSEERAMKFLLPKPAKSLFGRLFSKST